MRRKIIIFGATHTGIALAKRTMADFDVVLCDDKPSPEHAVDAIYRSSVDLIADATYFVLHDDDSKNIKDTLTIKRAHREVPVYTVLTQDSLAEKFDSHLVNFWHINQAQLAAEHFVNAIYKDRPRSSSEPTLGVISRKIVKMDPLIRKAATFILGLMTFSTLFFHFRDNLSFIDAFYFTITMMTTVGFGDFSLKDADAMSKLVGCLVMVLSIVSTAIIFALVCDSIVRKRKELTHGVNRFKGEDHVIVVGAGSVGSRVVAELLAKGEQPVIIDKNVEARYVRDIIAAKIPFIIGDARNERLLVDANISKAKAVLAVTQDDLVNLEIGLDAKHIHPEASVVLRIYNQDLSASLRDNDIIEHTYSMSSVAADYFVTKLRETA